MNNFLDPQSVEQFWNRRCRDWS